MVNRVRFSEFFRTIIVGGRQLDIGFATETEAWRRIYIAEIVLGDFTRAIRKAKIPKKAAAAVLVLVSFMATWQGPATDNTFSEKVHSSASDLRGHFTTVYRDRERNHITTKHVLP